MTMMMMTMSFSRSNPYPFCYFYLLITDFEMKAFTENWYYARYQVRCWTNKI